MLLAFSVVEYKPFVGFGCSAVSVINAMAAGSQSPSRKTPGNTTSAPTAAQLVQWAAEAEDLVFSVRDVVSACVADGRFREYQRGLRRVLAAASKLLRVLRFLANITKQM